MSLVTSSRWLAVSPLLLLLSLLLLCTPSCTAHEHAPLRPGQDKDNFWPWEKLLSAEEMLIAQRDGPSPFWRPLFQAMAASPPASFSPILVFNVSNPILPAFARLYSPSSTLVVTPYPLTISSPSPNLRVLPISLFFSQPPNHLHSLCLFLASTSPHSDRRAHDRRSLKAIERAAAPGARVLILQRWEGSGRYWGDVLVPRGWEVEGVWGWVRDERGWVREREGEVEHVRKGDGDVLSVFGVRVRADVEAGDGEGVGDEVTEAVSTWDAAVAETSPPVTWMPYHKQNRL